MPAESSRTLHRSLALVRLLSTRTATGWRLSDLAGDSGLDVGTVHRLLAGLVDERLASRVPGTKRYALGPLAYELGLAAMPHFSLASVASSELATLADETRDALFLNVRSAADSVCVARIDGRVPLKAYTIDVGTRRPLCLSAGGVAMLIALPAREQAALVKHSLAAIARGGEARRAAVLRMLARSRRLGYGLNLEDIIPGIAALAVAIRNPVGDPVASLTLATTRALLRDPRRAKVLARVRSTAKAIEARMAPLRY